MGTRAAVHIIKNLDQIRALADPLRQQILGGFVSQPRTTKQVAELLELPATRLYRHVDHLERVGLIELVETRQKRGTTEKYFRAIANRFSIAAESLGDEGGSMIERSLSNAYRQIQANIRDGANQIAGKMEMVLALGSLRIAPEDVPIVQERILEMVKDLPSDPKDRKPFGYLVALYPSEDASTESD
jgi:predicted transcriptional regulator